MQRSISTVFAPVTSESRKRRPLVSATLSALALAALACASTAAAQTLRVDAAAPVPPPQHGHRAMGTGTGLAGTVEVNSRYISLDGRPFIPITGEFHHSRFPDEASARPPARARSSSCAG